VNQFKFYIDHDYKYTLYLDDLPSAVGLRDKHNEELPVNYFDGIPVGFYSVDEITGMNHYAIYNHFDITVIINHTVENHQRVVGFEVEPRSIMEGSLRKEIDQKKARPQWIEQGQSEAQQLRFSYRIITRVSD
jgi:Endomembrane protein 70